MLSFTFLKISLEKKTENVIQVEEKVLNYAFLCTHVTSSWLLLLGLVVWQVQLQLQQQQQYHVAATATSAMAKQSTCIWRKSFWWNYFVSSFYESFHITTNAFCTYVMRQHLSWEGKKHLEGKHEKFLVLRIIKWIKLLNKKYMNFFQ